MRHRAFTLIELLVVIAIICILTGILVPVISYAINKGATTKTRILIGGCQTALENYYSDHQRYPWVKQPEVAGLVAAGKASEVEITTVKVVTELSGGGPLNTEVNYLDSVNSRMKKDLGKGLTLVDGWGREIFFRVDTEDGGPVVWSAGRNGRDETADGSSPDPATRPESYYLFTSGDDGDDEGSR
jgi:prepilin-type N-terminal cleavage/methylation domain-containing protein